MAFVGLIALYYIIASFVVLFMNFSVLWTILLSTCDWFYAISGFVFTNRLKLEKGA